MRSGCGEGSGLDPPLGGGYHFTAATGHARPGPVTLVDHKLSEAVQLFWAVLGSWHGPGVC